MNSDAANENVDDLDDTSLADLLFDGPAEEEVRAAIPGFPDADTSGPGTTAEPVPTVEPVPELVEEPAPKQPLVVTVVTNDTASNENLGATEDDIKQPAPDTSTETGQLINEPDETETDDDQHAEAAESISDDDTGDDSSSTGDGPRKSTDTGGQTLSEPEVADTAAQTEAEDNVTEPGSDGDRVEEVVVPDEPAPVAGDQVLDAAEDTSPEQDAAAAANPLLNPYADETPSPTAPEPAAEPKPAAPAAPAEPVSPDPVAPATGVPAAPTAAPAAAEPASPTPVAGAAEPIQPIQPIQPIEPIQPIVEDEPEPAAGTKSLKDVLTTPISLRRTTTTKSSLKDVLTTPISFRRKTTAAGVADAALDGIARYIDTKERWTPKNPQRVIDAAAVMNVKGGTTPTETLTRIANQLLVTAGHNKPAPETVHAVALTLIPHLDGDTNATDHKNATRVLAHAAARQPNPKTWITKAAEGFNNQKVAAALTALNADPGSKPAAQQALVATAEAVAITLHPINNPG